MSFADATQFWNERFDKEEFIFGKEPNEYLVEKTNQYLKSKNKVLCIADGEGRNGVWLAKQGMQETHPNGSEENDHVPFSAPYHGACLHRADSTASRRRRVEDWPAG